MTDVSLTEQEPRKILTQRECEAFLTAESRGYYFPEKIACVRESHAALLASLVAAQEALRQAEALADRLITESIERWNTTTNDEAALHDWLGLTWAEYKAYVEGGGVGAVLAGTAERPEEPEPLTEADKLLLRRALGHHWHARVSERAATERLLDRFAERPEEQAASALLSPVAEEGQTEVATSLPQWFIERGQPERQAPTVWLALEGAMRPASHQWTTVASEAAMFPTRKLAEDFIREHFTHPIRGASARATEHLFIGWDEASGPPVKPEPGEAT